MIRRRLLAALLLASVAPRAVAAGKKPEKKKSGGESFLPVGGVSATANKGGGRRGVLSVECGLDVPDEKLRDAATKAMPRLRAGYMQALTIYAGGLAPLEPPDPDILSQTLQRQTDIVLGRRGARFLLGSIILN